MSNYIEKKGRPLAAVFGVEAARRSDAEPTWGPLPAPDIPHPDSAAERIRYYHELARRSAQLAVMAAVAAGLELLAAKDNEGHGNFIRWIEKNCGFSRMTAFKYMALAGAAFGGEAAALAVAAEEDPRPAIAAAARELDGQSLSQLYKTLGIVKASKGWGGAGRVQGRKPADLAAESAELARDPGLAAAECGGWIGRLYDWAVSRDGWDLLSDKDLLAARASLRDIAARADAIIDSRKAGRAAILSASAVAAETIGSTSDKRRTAGRAEAAR